MSTKRTPSESPPALDAPTPAADAPAPADDPSVGPDEKTSESPPQSPGRGDTWCPSASTVDENWRDRIPDASPRSPRPTVPDGESVSFSPGGARGPAVKVEIIGPPNCPSPRRSFRSGDIGPGDEPDPAIERAERAAFEVELGKLAVPADLLKDERGTRAAMGHADAPAPADDREPAPEEKAPPAPAVPEQPNDSSPPPPDDDLNDPLPWRGGPFPTHPERIPAAPASQPEPAPAGPSVLDDVCAMCGDSHPDEPLICQLVHINRPGRVVSLEGTARMSRAPRAPQPAPRACDHDWIYGTHDEIERVRRGALSADEEAARAKGYTGRITPDEQAAAKVMLEAATATPDGKAPIDGLADLFAVTDLDRENKLRHVLTDLASRIPSKNEPARRFTQEERERAATLIEEAVARGETEDKGSPAGRALTLEAASELREPEPDRSEQIKRTRHVCAVLDSELSGEIEREPTEVLAATLVLGSVLEARGANTEEARKLATATELSPEVREEIRAHCASQPEPEVEQTLLLARLIRARGYDPKRTPIDIAAWVCCEIGLNAKRLGPATTNETFDFSNADEEREHVGNNPNVFDGVHSFRAGPTQYDRTTGVEICFFCNLHRDRVSGEDGWRFFRPDVSAIDRTKIASGCICPPVERSLSEIAAECAMALVSRKSSTSVYLLATALEYPPDTVRDALFELDFWRYVEITPGNDKSFATYALSPSGQLLFEMLVDTPTEGPKGISTWNQASERGESVEATATLIEDAAKRVRLEIGLALLKRTGSGTSALMLENDLKTPRDVIEDALAKLVDAELVSFRVLTDERQFDGKGASIYDLTSAGTEHFTKRSIEAETARATFETTDGEAKIIELDEPESEPTTGGLVSLRERLARVAKHWAKHGQQCEANEETREHGEAWSRAAVELRACLRVDEPTLSELEQLRRIDRAARPVFDYLEEHAITVKTELWKEFERALFDGTRPKRGDGLLEYVGSVIAPEDCSGCNPSIDDHRSENLCDDCRAEFNAWCKAKHASDS